MNTPVNFTIPRIPVSPELTDAITQQAEMVKTLNLGIFQRLYDLSDEAFLDRAFAEDFIKFLSDPEIGLTDGPLSVDQLESIREALFSAITASQLNSMEIDMNAEALSQEVQHSRGAAEAIVKSTTEAINHAFKIGCKLSAFEQKWGHNNA